VVTVNIPQVDQERPLSVWLQHNEYPNRYYFLGKCEPPYYGYLDLQKIEQRTFQDLIILETSPRAEVFEVDYTRPQPKPGTEREFAAFLQVNDKYMLLGSLNIYQQSVDRDGLWNRTGTSGKDYILGADPNEQVVFLNFPYAYWEGLDQDKKQAERDAIDAVKIHAKNERKRKVKRALNKLKV